MATVPATKVVTADEAAREELPEAVQLALGDLAGAARQGLLALSVGVGLGVVHELIAAEVDEVCGPKGKHDPKRAATRWSAERGSVTLGGRRVAAERPRMRTPDAEREVPLRAYEHFASRGPLTELAFERIMAGVSCRGYERTNEPVGSEVEAEAKSTSKSAVNRAFVERTRSALGELMSRRLDDVRLAAMMIDGIELSERTHVVCLGITTEGVKIPLGLWEGSTENATVAKALLADLVDRGLDPEQGILFVIDGAKALRRAIREVFGERAPVQRCVRHKERNVLDHLPERDRQVVRSRLRSAWALRRPPPRDRAAEGAGARARPHLLRRGGVAARGPRGDRDRAAARRRRAAAAHDRLHQPLRVDDRDRPPHPAQCEALAGRRHAAALDGGGYARGRAPVPEDHRLPPPR